MSLKEIKISNYSSIKEISIKLLQNNPIILFGPNNARKSNILSALDRLLGERYPIYIPLEDSDYFMGDKEKYPRVEIKCSFSKPYHIDKYCNVYNEVTITYGHSIEAPILLHDGNN